MISLLSDATKNIFQDVSSRHEDTSVVLFFFVAKQARFIKNCWSREQGTVTKLLADLKWDTLQVRREKARLLMFYKATHGLVDIPLPDTLIPLSVRNTWQYHPKKFYPMVSNTKSYKGTFFPSTVAMWNSLPLSVLDKPNISQFRQALDHFY